MKEEGLSIVCIYIYFYLYHFTFEQAVSSAAVSKPLECSATPFLSSWRARINESKEIDEGRTLLQVMFKINFCIESARCWKKLELLLTCS